MKINGINNVSFGAILVLDRATKSYIDNSMPHEKAEFDEFKKSIENIGTPDDIVEISNFTKHHASILTDDEKIYALYKLNGYSADLKINGTLNKINIKDNCTRFQFIWKQILQAIQSDIKNTKVAKSFIWSWWDITEYYKKYYKN